MKETCWLTRIPIILKNILFALAVLGGLTAGTALGQDTKSVDVQALMKRMDEMEKVNEALSKRVEELEKKLQEKGSQAPETPKEPAAPAEQQAPTESSVGSATAGTNLHSRWHNGLRVESDDGSFRLKIGGRIMFDMAHIDGPDYWQLGGPEIDENDGTELRRLRIRLSGNVYEDYFYKLEVDFADNDAEIIDAFVGMNDIPYVGTFQVGQFAEPFGLEALTSANYITFMERSMATQAFIPYRSRGAAFSSTFLNDRLTLSAGVFNGGIEQDNHWNITGRITGLPWYANDGRRLLHLGAAYSHRNPESEYAFAARPGSHLADEHFDTGELPADEVDLWGAETAVVLGPFSLQGEFVRADVSFVPEHRDLTFLEFARSFKIDDRHFDGWYAQASYFLTGENRVYNPKSGAFDRVIPRRPFALHGGGLGAWELAARYEDLSLDDFDIRSGVIGGKGHNWTAGVNWHMTSNVRLMLNYVKSTVDQFAYDGTIDIIEGRFQADF